MPFKLEQLVKIKGEKTDIIFTIDLIVNGEALLKFNNKGILKISHWQHCSDLTAVKTTQAVSGANNRSRL